MKKNEKKMLLILILVAALIIGVIYFATRPKDEVKATGGKTTASSAAQGEFTKVEEGTIVNTSEKLKEDKKMKGKIEKKRKKLKEKKEEEGFALTNIKLEEKNGETVLSARVTNKTGAAQETFIGNVVLLDKSGNEVGRIPVRISDTQDGESIDIEASITESYANAYNFKLEK